jgi:hypothetical protein
MLNHKAYASLVLYYISCLPYLLRLLILCIVAQTLYAQTLYAQTTTPNSDSDEQQVAQLQLQAVQAARVQSYDEALVLLKQAQEIKVDSKTLFLIAKIHSRAKHCMLGSKAWNELIYVCKEDCRFYQESLQLQAEHDQICESSIVLQGTPARTRVYLNEKYMGQTPIEYKVTAGSYVIKLEYDGYVSQSFKKILKPQEKQKVVFNLEANQIGLINPNYKSLAQSPTFIVQQNSNSKYKILPLLGLITGSLTIATGAFLIFQSLEQADSIRTDARQELSESNFQQLLSDYEDRQSREMIAWGMIGSGFVLSVISTFFLLKDESKNKITRIQIHNDKEILLPTQPQIQIIPFLNPYTHSWGLGFSTRL